MINIYTENDIQNAKECGKSLARILFALQEYAKQGISTFDIDKEARVLSEKENAKPAFLNYKPKGAKRAFPGALCISINDQVVHGIPNENNYILKNGDVITLDMGLYKNNMYTDSARTIVVGGYKQNIIAANMIEVAMEALDNAIKTCIVGKKTGDIGYAIQDTIRLYKKGNFSIPEELGGHGIGYTIHEDPFIPNFGKKNQGVLLKNGMIIAIEPILTEKKPYIKIMPDNYTLITKDNGLSVHVEDTIAIYNNKAINLTRL